MSADSYGQVTRLIHAAQAGDPTAPQRLYEVVYDEIKALARAAMRHERRRITLQTTVLAHDAYLRLCGDARLPWPSRKYFFGAVAIAMRRILVDYARARESAKRGGRCRRVSLDAVEQVPQPAELAPSEVLAVNEALHPLAAQSPRLAEVVDLRYFAGRSVEETVLMLGLSPRTVELDWQFARAWLLNTLGDGQDGATDATPRGAQPQG